MLLFSSYKNLELKIKLWLKVKLWVGGKKMCIFLTFILPLTEFLHLYFFSMYGVLNKFSEYIYFYISKSLFHMLFCLLLKWPKAFSVSLKSINNFLMRTKLLTNKKNILTKRQGFAKTLHYWNLWHCTKSEVLHLGFLQ